MKTFLSTAVIMAMATTSAMANQCTNITKEEVDAAQKEWGQGIVAIGQSENPKAAAENHLDTLYGYEIGNVLFKPTKAKEDQFRNTREKALSYFVKGVIPEDKGFALAPFTNVRFENKSSIIDCDSALAMGNYYFTTQEGKDVKVEYSFGYVKDEEGKLKINLHHSSLPYQS
ncbi:MAG: hypothetical protein MK137_04225 [Rickettsiales bacterium]|nr:hypothetical protein [Rickettsiales bacterium]